MNPEISYYRLGGLQASGNFLIKKVPTAGDTITIDGETFTFGTTFNGDTIYDVARSLKLAINADSSTYAHAHTSINPSRSTYAIYYGPRVVVVASVPGTAGNSIAIASSNTDAIEASGATLSGGTAGPLIGGGGGGGGTPGDTVITETTYGQAESAGVATEFSRADHTHGTPALPTPADIGASGRRLTLIGEGARTLVSGSTLASGVTPNEVRQKVAAATACVVRISFGSFISPYGSGNGYVNLNFANSFRVSLSAIFDAFLVTATKACIYIPGTNSETTAVLGRAGFAIHVVGNAAGNPLMSLAVHDGSSLTESTPTELAYGLTEVEDVVFQWLAGTSATLWINGGEWAQITTGLPTGTLAGARYLTAVLDTDTGQPSGTPQLGIRGCIVESM